MKSQITVIVLTIMFIALVSCKKDDSKNGPIASFKVDPETGYTFTKFIFNASTSTDQEDPLSSLQTRWDWDADGNWDTKFSYNIDTSHYYDIPGVYNVKLEVMDADGWTSFCIEKITVLQDTSTMLLAPFSVNPQGGTTITIFSFDATNTINLISNESNIQIRWDWEGDGIWDTGFRKDPKAYHRYINTGTYLATIEVKYGNNLNSLATQTLVIN